MADFEELSFVIPGYTPETIPLDRLLEYLQQMAQVLGDTQNLHLIEIRKSSVAPVFRVPKAAALAAKERANRVQRGDGTKKQVDAFNRISKMLRRDSRDAGKPALLRSGDRVLLKIPAAPQDTGVLSGIRQPSTVDGQLIRVGGTADDAALQIQDLEGRIMSGFTAKRSLAKELAKLMWEPVRLSGDGQWCRTEEGNWLLERMQVHSYELLEDEDLSVVLERLRSVDVRWPADVHKRLRQERDESL
ncbi:hypothetical protein [Sphingomonas sp.]|uniref:hypothetical protein n=1 Tax=Sphingomonas sp. TaxID=28214 RepID=UPI003B3B1B77